MKRIGQINMIMRFPMIPWIEDISIKHKNGRTWGYHRSFYTRCFEDETLSNCFIRMENINDEAHKVDAV